MLGLLLMSGLQMNGVQQNRREKPVPGCLGRVVNLFDLTSGVARNKLLTEKPHFPDGSSLTRSRSDVTRTRHPIADEMEDKMIVSEVTRSSSTKRFPGTPVKMLIAQELSEDFESRHSSPNLVARLMGIDAIPDSANGRSKSSCHTRKCYSEVPVGCRQQDNESFDRGIINHEIHYKDVHEIRQTPFKTNGSRDVSHKKGRRNENTNEKKMALVRQKFVDAKRLSTDEKLRQTKEFQDALEVLSSNPDLFLKVLQEPSSLISHHLNGGQPLSLSTETKRITILRPSKQAKKSTSGNQATWRVDESPPRPTRIVVLKPSSGRILDTKRPVCSMPSSPQTHLHYPGVFSQPRDDDTQEAREVAREITQRIRENLDGCQTDEAFSSVFSNPYSGNDNSPSNKSEVEFVGNLSDSEVMSPVSRHSWDYINRNSSPYTCSSLGRISFSPESSVVREAKKRLSERWAMMSSTEVGEHRQMQRSASTLGEMLALSDVKPEIYEGDVQSPRSLMRSKSLPVSSTASGLRLDVDSLHAEAHKVGGSTKQMTKSSFRGKVTRLFFPRSKKLTKEKTDESQYQHQATTNHTEFFAPFGIPNKEIKSPDVQSVNRTIWAELNEKSGEGLASQQVALSTSKPATYGVSSENPDQPSPISVLEPPFEEDGSHSAGFSDAFVLDHDGKYMSFTSGRSNLIDKSPPIGSIARTLTWDEPCALLATSDPLKSPFLSPQDGANEGEWLALVESLLSEAGIENESQLSSNLTRWYSPERPLDPLLKEKYVDLPTEEPLKVANRRRLRSNRLLVFDFVNVALMDMTGMGSDTSFWSHYKTLKPTPVGETLADRVWAQMKELLWSGGWETKEVEEDGEDSGNLAAEMAVKKELLGREWDDLVKLQIDIIGNEIEGKLLEELVEESIW